MEGNQLRKRALKAFYPFLLLLVLAVMAPVAASADVVTISYAHTGHNPPLERMVELFNEEHTNIQVEYRAVSGFYEAIPVQVAGGTGPDVFFVHPKDVAQWSEGVLLDLTPFVERDPASINLDQYFPIALELSKANGRLYSMPFGIVETGRVIYNAEMLGSAGIAEPTGDWTWPEYKALAQRLTVDDNADGVPEQYGTSGFGWREIIHYAIEEGGRFFSDGFREFLPDRTESINAFEFAASLHLDGLTAPSTVSDFVGGHLAFMLTHLPGAIHYGNDASQNFTVASAIQPQHSNGARHFFVTANMFGINPNISEERRQAAWEFISWANAPEGFARASSQAFGACQLYPARRDAALSEYCMATTVPGLRPELSLDIISYYSIPETTPPTWSQVLNAFNSSWTSNVVTGEMAPAAFYDSVIGSINAGLRQSN